MSQTITVSEILAELQAGATRADIGTKYGLNGVQVKALFLHPKLKNKKTIKEKGAAFILVDDTEVSASVPGSAIAEDTTEQQEHDLAAADLAEETSEITEVEFEQPVVNVIEAEPVVQEAAPIETETAKKASKTKVDEPVEAVKESGLGW